MTDLATLTKERDEAREHFTRIVGESSVSRDALQRLLLAERKLAVEECCAQMCSYCSIGWPLDPKYPAEFHMPPEGNGYTMAEFVKCSARRIRTHFGGEP